jgi:hypothetical protein
MQRGMASVEGLGRKQLCVCEGRVGKVGLEGPTSRF